MIERKFIGLKLKEKLVQEFIGKELDRSGHSKIEIKKTPLGDKIVVYTSRPGLIVGKKGENIKRLTDILKNKFGMENPQIEVGEIENPFLDAYSVADNIAYTFERFGPKRFKFIGYDTLTKIMKNGALGAEIIIGGKGVPGARAKSWRFSAGYLKKSGDISVSYVKRAHATANLRSGTIGIKVAIMTKDVDLPDRINIKDIKVEEIKEGGKASKEEKDNKNGNTKEK